MFQKVQLSPLSMNEEHVMDCSVDGNHLTAHLDSSSADFGT
jgi:hypothetical protein